MEKKKLIIFTIGIICGIFYYLNMRLSIKKHEENCSFVSNKLTDILAFIIGGMLIYYGLYKYNNINLSIIGTAIITEHILQFSYKI